MFFFAVVLQHLCGILTLVWLKVWSREKISCLCEPLQIIIYALLDTCFLFACVLDFCVLLLTRGRGVILAKKFRGYFLNEFLRHKGRGEEEGCADNFIFDFKEGRRKVQAHKRACFGEMGKVFFAVDLVQ